MFNFAHKDVPYGRIQLDHSTRTEANGKMNARNLKRKAANDQLFTAKTTFLPITPESGEKTGSKFRP